MGVGFLTFAVLFAAAGLLTLAKAPHHGARLALTLVALVAAAFPYGELIGVLGYGLNAALTLLAVSSAVRFVATSRP